MAEHAGSVRETCSFWDDNIIWMRAELMGQTLDLRVSTKSAISSVD